jgi:hypothetical protein
MTRAGLYDKCVGLARTIYIRCVYGIFGREITIFTVIYGVYIRFWVLANPTNVSKYDLWRGVLELPVLYNCREV